MNQNLKGASLTTTRLSPLAKPFTLNRSNHQLTSNLSVLSAQEPSIYSSDDYSNDPFSSLLDSFRHLNHFQGSKGDSVVSVPLPLALGDYGFGQKTATTTLPVENATQTHENSLCRRHPSLEFPNNGNDVVSSAADGSMFQKGKHAVDGLNPCQAVSDGASKKSTGTNMAEDILSNSKGTIHTDGESSSILMSNCEVAPLPLSTSDMSSAAKLKDTLQIESSNNLVDSDSDVDSPCWKGTMAFGISPPEISGSAKSQDVKKAPEKHNSLNPLAPQFFPGVGYIKDDFVSSNSNAPVAIDLLTGEDMLMKTVTGESHPVELNKGIELQYSSNIYVGEKTFNKLNDPESSSVDPVLNSRMMTQSSSTEDCSTSKGKLVTVVDVDGCVKGTKEPRASWSKSGSFPAKGHSPTSTSSSSQVGVVTDLLKTLEGVSKSLIESPSPDVQIMVNAMHVLSELLVQTCVNGLDSYNQHDQDMIQKIINNLNVFGTRKCGHRTPTVDSTHTDSPCHLDRSSELLKGFEVTSIKTLAVPHQLYQQNDFMGQTSVSKMVSRSGQNSFASSSEGTGKGNEIAQLQVIRRSLGRSLDFEKQMHPEALLFRNLWLDAEAERCFRRYKTYLYLMEAGMDVNGTNVAELWR